MREAVGLPAGFLVYLVSTVILLNAVQVTFAAPQHWSTYITAVIAIISFKVTCAAVGCFSNEAGVKIVGVMIAMFWMASLGVDFFSGAEQLFDFLSGGEHGSKGMEHFKELVEAVWNSKICAGISVVLALWTLTK